MKDKFKITKRAVLIISIIIILGGTVTGLLIWQTKSNDKESEETWQSIKASDKEWAEKAETITPVAQELLDLRAKLKTLSPGTPEYNDIQDSIDHASLEIASKFPGAVKRWDENGVPIILDDKELMDHLNTLKAGQ